MATEGLNSKRRAWALLLGPTLAAGAALALQGSTLSPSGVATAAVGVWMAAWWLAEAVDIPVTALLPLALFVPLNIASPRDAAAPYAHELIFLFMGSFILALSMARWGLDRRIARLVLARAGTSPAALLAAIMGTAAVLSAWVSNTAVAAMFLPILLGILDSRVGVDPAEDRVGQGLLIGLAWGATIGGCATLIGTPPNLFLASFARETLGQEIGFARWMMVGLPVAGLLLPVGYVLLRMRFLRGASDLVGVDVTASRESLSRGEWATMLVFFAVVFGWLARPWLSGQLGISLTDAQIVVAGAILLFAIPADGRRVMDWDACRDLPWGVLILFGGGLSLASALDANGVSAWIGIQLVSLGQWPLPVLLLGVVGVTVFLTEFTSNTATAVALLPVLSGLAAQAGIEQAALLVAVALACSCAFMMPVATPPNAIVFASGRLTVPILARAGFAMNLAAIVVLVAVVLWVPLPDLG